MWNNNVSIWDNRGISIGTIICYFAPDVVENTMPDGIPLLHSILLRKVTITPRYHQELMIDDNIRFWLPDAFCPNNCIITLPFCIAEDSRCVGYFCHKEWILEVHNNNQGCCCYSFDARKGNIVIDNILEVQHILLNQDLKFKNYSLVKFSLLYQNLVFNTQIQVLFTLGY